MKEPAVSVVWHGGVPTVTCTLYVVRGIREGTCAPYSVSVAERGVAAGDGNGLGGAPHAPAVTLAPALLGTICAIGGANGPYPAIIVKLPSGTPVAFGIGYSKSGGAGMAFAPASSGHGTGPDMLAPAPPHAVNTSAMAAMAYSIRTFTRAFYPSYMPKAYRLSSNEET